MKRRSRAQSSTLFLMELIFAIVFFTLSSAVCVQFFVKSHIYSEEAQQLNSAVNECSGIAEIVAVSDSLEECTQTISDAYEASDVQNGSDTAQITAFYDDAFQLCSQDEAAYQMDVILNADDGMLSADMTYTNVDTADQEPIYQLQTQHYMQGGAQ